MDMTESDLTFSLIEIAFLTVNHLPHADFSLGLVE
jgi:hypothetical protein